MTTLLLPADACPRCLANAVQVIAHPQVNLPAGPASIYSHYECSRCNHKWFTGWALDAMTTPCPGCPACTNQKGQAA